MKLDRSLLYVIIVSPLLEFGIVIVSWQVPGLLTTAATTSSVPAPTLLGVVWGVMFAFVVGIVPLLAVAYVWDKGMKVVAALVVAEALTSYFFFGAHPNPLLGLPALVWLHIPVAVAVGSAIVLKRAFAARSNVAEAVASFVPGR
jgi:hypothetical protein